MKRGAYIYLFFAATISLTAAFPNVAHAGWSHDPAVNTMIGANPGAQDINTAITDDGVGGAIIAWMGPAYDIYIQRIDADGNVLWGSNGKAITSNGNYFYPKLVSDGNGGAFITWQGGGDGSGGIFVQRVDAGGNALWQEGGEIVVVNNLQITGNHQNPRIVFDGVDGAVIVWQDSRNGEQNYDIYAQRVRSDPDGDLEELWPGNGTEVCTEDGHQYYPQLVGDGAGGAIITWQDGRNSETTGWDIYAQRIDANGLVYQDDDVQWETGGIAVCDATYHQEAPQIVGDGSGGAIITWQDGRTPANGYDVYAQRFNSNGEALWTEDGVAVSTGTDNQQDPRLVSDGSHGAIIAWWGIVNGGNPYGIYAQRIDGDGTAVWTPNGVTVADPTGIDTNGYKPQIVSDGSNGAVITWADQRNTTDENIYAQRTDGTDGHVLWPVNGVAVSTAANHQQHPVLIGNGSGGAIVTWQDLRNGDWDIYAQKVLSDGSLPVVAPTVTTATPTDIFAASATSGGVVTSDGGATVTARGVCWGGSPDPSLGGTCTSDGIGTGAFVRSITGLTPNTPYYVRAYATNSVGTAFGANQTFTTPAGLTLTVTVTGVGGGGGTVVSDPWGIDCITGSCYAFFQTGSQVTLTALPDSDSIGAWGGDCVITDGKCMITMGGARTATATFNYVQPVRIMGSSTKYTSIGGAYAGLPSGGGTIQARIHEFTEPSLIFNRSITAIFKGGYDTAYSSPPGGLTTVHGTVTVQKGNLTVENLAIK
jgi:hypothetical protein